MNCMRCETGLSVYSHRCGAWDEDLVEYVDHPLYGDAVPMVTRDEAEAIKIQASKEG